MATDFAQVATRGKINLEQLKETERGESPISNLGTVKQVEAIRVDGMHPQVDGRPATKIGLTSNTHSVTQSECAQALARSL